MSKLTATELRMKKPKPQSEIPWPEAKEKIKILLREMIDSTPGISHGEYDERAKHREGLRAELLKRVEKL